MTLTRETYHNINFCIRCGSGLSLKIDKENKLRPHCPACGWTYYKNPIPAATCVIINNKKEILLVKRKNEPQAGKWALPSGYIEIDQNPEESAIEEMKEETGLTGGIDKFLGFYADFSPLYEKVISFGFLMQVTGGLLQAGDDAAEACYVPLDKLPPLAFTSHNFFIKQVVGS
ncbi:MAG: NUDIX hydrolase [Candidatus Cloacimonetes bacterium]|nr:NUDIX hydrolase [Candidatus Cloacimonadota bacterium]